MFELVLRGCCTWCGECAELCPSGALSFQEELLSWDSATCNKCETCADVCDMDALRCVWK